MNCCSVKFLQIDASINWFSTGMYVEPCKDSLIFPGPTNLVGFAKRVGLSVFQDESDENSLIFRNVTQLLCFSFILKPTLCAFKPLSIPLS